MRQNYNWLRALAVLLAVLMLGAMLGGCSDKIKPVESTEQTTEEITTEEVTTEEPTTQEAATTEPENEPAAESGCKSVTAGAFALVAMIAVAFVAKKKE